MGALARVLSWIRKAPEVLADGARPDGPSAWIRSDDGGLTRMRTRFEREFKVFVGGVPHEHVDTLADGVWVYAAREY